MQDPFESARRRMVDIQIRDRGIQDQRVLDAFYRVPRHLFVEGRFQDQAYRDSPLPIGENQTISQPYMVASMTATAAIQPGEKVLEIGTGSGYQAAILAEMGAHVLSVERHPALSQRAEEIIKQLGYDKVRFKVANGTLGWPEEAPFDAIIVTAGAPEIPQPLAEQLSEGGRLVIPVKEGFSQVLYLVTRSQGRVEKTRGERCTFVPLLGKHGWKPGKSG